jgi:acetolactate synthase I/II/III large subunit
VMGAAHAGVDTWFANPGTTELHLVQALDRVPNVKSVLCLEEGVVTGACDGYGRMARRPAAGLLHLGPGLANGIANQHNAKRAFTPMVTVVGDHATWHAPADAPLTTDIYGLADPVSVWVRKAKSARSIVQEAINAVQAAQGFTSGPATLIVPQDVTWTQNATGKWRYVGLARPSVGVASVERCTRELVAAKRPVIVLGGAHVDAAAQQAAARIRELTGATVVLGGFVPRAEVGRDTPGIEPLPYFPEQSRPVFADTDLVILIGVADPVTFFGYPDQPSRVIPDGVKVIELTDPGRVSRATVELLADMTADHLSRQRGRRPEIAKTKVKRVTGSLDGKAITAATLGEVLVRTVPEGAIVVNEALSNAGAFRSSFSDAAPHTHLVATTGGAIGNGLPVALGAAVATPDRPVIAVQADGSAAYSLQALWSMARSGANVTVVLLANRRYAILDVEVARFDVQLSQRQLTDLSGPAIDWVALAKGFGVPGVRVETADQLATQLARRLKQSGPSLIEAVM